MRKRIGLKPVKIKIVKNKIEQQELLKSNQLQALSLLNNPEYMQARKEYEEIIEKDKEISREIAKEENLIPKKDFKKPPKKYHKHIQKIIELATNRAELHMAGIMETNKIRIKYSVPCVYPKYELQEIAKGNDIFLKEPKPILYAPDSGTDENGYHTLKYKPECNSREALLHLFNTNLHAYLPMNQRLRGTTFDPVEIWKKVHIEKRSCYGIAQELSGKNKFPSDEEYSKKHHKIFLANKKGVERALEKAHTLMGE